MIVLCVHRVNIKMAVDKLLAKIAQEEGQDQYIQMMTIHGIMVVIKM